jgi:microcystin-dependent protein
MLIPEETATDLSDISINKTFQGLLHMPRSVIINTNIKQVIYDGLGTPTSLYIGQSGSGLTIVGDTIVRDSLYIINNFTLDNTQIIRGNFKTILGNTQTKINDVIFYYIQSDITIRVLSGLESGKLRIRDSEKLNDNFELIYGEPNIPNVDQNLFTIKVNNDSDNNFYIKNIYTEDDINSPLWINRKTGEVNIKHLKVERIITIGDPQNPGPGPDGPRTYDRHRHEIAIGQICLFAVSGVPDGWLTCDGTAYEIKVFPELHSKIGRMYTDDPKITGDLFCVPDLRGLFVRHYDHPRDDEDPAIYVYKDADKEDRSFNKVQIDTLSSHFHYIPGLAAPNEDINVPSFYNGLVTSTPGTTWFPPGQPPVPTTVTTKAIMPSLEYIPTDIDQVLIKGSPTAKSFKTGDLETRPKNIALVYAIKW